MKTESTDSAIWLLLNTPNAKHDRITQIMQTILDDFENQTMEISTHIPTNQDQLNQINDFQSDNLIYLFLILAEKRYQEAFPLICQFLQIESERTYYCVMDHIFHLGRTIASVFDGNLEPLKQIIENEELHPMIRCTGLKSILVSLANDVLERRDVVGYFKYLFEEGLEQYYSDMWDYLISAAIEIHPGDLSYLIEHAYQKQLVNPKYVGPKWVYYQLEREPEVVLNEFKSSNRNRLIESAIELV